MSAILCLVALNAVALIAQVEHGFNNLRFKGDFFQAWEKTSLGAKTHEEGRQRILEGRLAATQDCGRQELTLVPGFSLWLFGDTLPTWCLIEQIIKVIQLSFVLYQPQWKLESRAGASH